MRPPRPQHSARAVEAWADDLRAEVKRVWASEAVRRGVAHAKARDAEAALRCYNQALELDPRQIDAYVARGAAHANDKRCGAAAAGRAPSPLSFPRRLAVSPC